MELNTLGPVSFKNVSSKPGRLAAAAQGVTRGAGRGGATDLAPRALQLLGTVS